MYAKSKCEDCFKPAIRRLALFRAKDEYDCYAESYIKCFWGLCDLHKSNDSFTVNPDGKVIIHQPLRQELPYKNSSVSQDILVNN